MMKILYETDLLKLEHSYEYIRLVDKRLGTVLMEDEFHGDPTCGLIDTGGQWAVVGGVHLTIWTPEKLVRRDGSEPKGIHAMREMGDGCIELLTDPWGENPAIWKVDAASCTAEKVRDFPDYQGKEYTEEIQW